MFDETRRALRRLEGGQQISVSLPSDAEGYFDRKCPSLECLEFKVHEDDWRDKVRDEKVFCAFCGHTANSSEWSTQQQQEYLEKAALAHLQGSLGRAMRRDAESWNRRQPRDSFIKITIRGWITALGRSCCRRRQRRCASRLPAPPVPADTP